MDPKVEKPDHPDFVKYIFVKITQIVASFVLRLTEMQIFLHK